MWATVESPFLNESVVEQNFELKIALVVVP